MSIVYIKDFTLKFTKDGYVKSFIVKSTSFTVYDVYLYVAQKSRPS